MEDLRNMYQATAIVCAGMIGSLFIYVAVVESTRVVFGDFNGFLTASSLELVKYGFYVLALTFIVAITTIKARISEVRSFDAPSVIISKLSKAAFLISGLSEIPAVLGLLLFLLGGLHTDFYILWFLSLMLMLLQFPRLTAWEYLARRARGIQ